MASIDICYWWESVWRILIFVFGGQVYGVINICYCKLTLAYWQWQVYCIFISGIYFTASLVYDDGYCMSMI